MTSKAWKLAGGAAAGLMVLFGLAGAAMAVSTGGYSPSQQDCPADADANTTQSAYPGCHNFKLNVSNGSGARFAQFGIDQEAQGQNAHAFDVLLTPNGDTPGSAYSGPALGAHVDTNYQPIPAGQCGLEDIALYAIEEALYLSGQGPKPCTLDPTGWNAPSGPPTVSPTVQAGTPDASLASLLTGFQVYLGADDNLDTGEHDGVNGQYGTAQAVNGPSDGGDLELNWHPLQTEAWIADLLAVPTTHSVAPIAEDPVPVADFGGGSCADGICWGLYTSQRAVYHGTGKTPSRDVYDYQGKTWGPYDCNSGSPQNEKDCITEGGHTMDWYRQQEAQNVYAEPGVMLYEDPDPQGSPVLPNQYYPMPAAYAGTCGVVLGGGPTGSNPPGNPGTGRLVLPASPATNSAGQLVVDPTGC